MSSVAPCCVQFRRLWESRKWTYALHWESGHSTSSTSLLAFPGAPVVKNLPSTAGDVGPIPVSGRSPGEGQLNNHNSIIVNTDMFQVYSGLLNSSAFLYL